MWRSVPAISSARASALGRHQRDPETAVGGEALLRREVVGVDLVEVDGQAAGTRGGVDEDERVVGRAGRAQDRRHHGGGGLVVGPGVGVDALLGDRLGQRSGLALDHRGSRRATVRRRQRSANFEENSPKVRCWLFVADQAEGGDVPEGGGAAVAEHDLVAVGQVEEGGESFADAARRCSSPGAWRCEVPISSEPVAASASRWLVWIFEGPAPKRPSAGRRSAGIVIASVIGLTPSGTCWGGRT